MPHRRRSDLETRHFFFLRKGDGCETTSAEEKREILIDTMKLELTMEGLIKAKGFADAIVSCSDSYVNVIVKSESLEDGEVAQIVDVVQGQTQKDIDYIKIIPIE